MSENKERDPEFENIDSIIAGLTSVTLKQRLKTEIKELGGLEKLEALCGSLGIRKPSDFGDSLDLTWLKE
jgi:hypothetical protein